MRCDSSLFQGSSPDQIFPPNWIKNHSLLQESIEEQPTRLRCPPVEPEGELIEIIIQMLRTNRSLMRAEQPSLEQRDGQVNSGEKILAQFVGVVEHLVSIAKIPQPAVGSPPVGLNESSRLNNLNESWQKNRCRRISNANHSYPSDLPSISLGGNQYQTLAGCTSSPLTLARTPDEGFIDFDNAAQTIPTGPHHSPAQLVQPIPSGSVASQTQHPLKTQGTCPGFLVGQIPYGLKPKSQWLVRVCKESARGRRKVMFTTGTTVMRRFHLPHFLGGARRADDSVRPTQGCQVRTAGFLRREPVPHLDSGSGMVFHARTLHVAARGVKCIPR